MNTEYELLNDILYQLDSEIDTYDDLATLFDVYFPEYQLKNAPNSYCSSILVSPKYRIDNTPIGKIRLSQSFKLLDTEAQKLILKNEIQTLLVIEQSEKF